MKRPVCDCGHERYWHKPDGCYAAVWVEIGDRAAARTCRCDAFEARTEPDG